MVHSSLFLQKVRSNRSCLPKRDSQGSKSSRTEQGPAEGASELVQHEDGLVVEELALSHEKACEATESDLEPK
jgi:hypothetical protein